MPSRSRTGLNKKTSASWTLFRNVGGEAQVFEHLAANGLRLLTGVQVRDPLPNLPALKITFDDFPSHGQVVPVAGIRLLDAGLDNLGNVFADRQHVPRITFLRRWVKGFGETG